MGNQASSPPPPAPTTPPPPETSPAPPPPLPPPCDLQCQKAKKLAVLKQSLNSIDPDEDPEGYEKARIAYYTLLNGPGWLAQEKQRIAKQEVEPVTSGYQNQYNSLKSQQQSLSVFTSLADDLKAQEVAGEKENAYLKEQRMIEQDKALVNNRLAELNSGTPYTPAQSYAWTSWAVDIVIAILGLFVLYKLYSRFAGRVQDALPSPTVPDLSSP